MTDMANVIVIADSVAGIARDLASQYNIRVVPAANIMFEGKKYLDGETITAAEGYAMLVKSPDKFVTSAIEPNYLMNVFKELDGQARDILFVTISGKLSAVPETARIAKQLFENDKHSSNVTIYDSKDTASGQGIVTLQAAKAAANNMTIEQVTNVANQTRRNSGNIMLLDTLRYAYRTGRISKTSARIAALLNVKPISVVTDDGVVEMIDKVRSRDAGLKRIIELIKEQSKSDSLHFMVMHADDIEWATVISDELKKQFKCLSMVYGEYSPVMGFATGRGCISVGFVPELDLIK
jgi:DegV family protein with EDD domain